jgi:hypothetical protein
MKISYAITVCNEFLEIQKLVTFLLKNKRQEDEIVILYDQGNGDKGIEEYLRSKSVNGAFNWHSGKFEGNFSDWKNKLTSLCDGDYIFNIDADEMPTEDLINSLPYILEINPEIDIFLVPRINTVEGLTQEHINQWRWNLNEKGWVNFPDYQWRVYRNNPNIKWKNKVHEVLEGFKTSTLLPAEEEYCLYHPKTIAKQEKQNNYYNTL